MYLAHRCSELVAHIVNTNTRYNLPAFRKKLSRKYNHAGVAERFEDPQVRKSVEVDLEMIAAMNQLLNKLEYHIEKTARGHDYHTFAKYYVSKLTHKYNKGKALGIFTHKLGRAIYFLTAPG